MIQEFDELNSYEEYPPKHIVAEFVDFVIANTRNEPFKQTLEKLELLGDKQWHTYEESSVTTREKIKSFLLMHWSDNNDFLESALTIGYCFSLDKDFYKLALDKYCGESFDEFKSDLLNSPGNNIDPYWRLK